MSLQEAFRVSPSVMPGSAEAQKMTVTSGLTCLGALTKSSPIGSFVRTLLESSRWWSKARYLKWQIKPLFSTRATEFQDTNSERPLPFNESATTLAVTDTKSSRYLFRLAVSEPPTDGTESSSSDTVLLQTPTSVQTDETPESMRARAERNGYKNGTKFGSLTSQVKYDPRVQPFLKTPCTADSYTDNMKSKGVSGTSGTLAQEIVSGYAEKHRGLRLDMLPTPTAGEAEKYRLQYTPGSQMGTCLSAMAASGMLPTPSARDWKGKTNPGVVKEGSGCVYGETLPDTIDRVMSEYVEENEAAMEEDTQDAVAGTGSRLSPLFTEEMMGFPFLWTTLPFLQANGAQKR